ncbi:cytochrome P450, partial [Gammaproteobacteria bacterium]|nr:cytochrome P450 [Gammaproteobacteria bacterium]
MGSRKIKEHKQNTCSKITYGAIGFFKDHLISSFSYDVKFNNALYLEGNVFFGQALRVLDYDGQGVGKVITDAAKLANNSESKMCWWRFGLTKKAFLVLNPEDIQRIIFKNKDKLLNHDSTGSFDTIFGKDTIFALSYGSDKWREARNKFTHFLFTERSLKNACYPINIIINNYIDIIHSKSKQIDIKTLSSHFAMDIIGDKLGLPQVNEHTKNNILNYINIAAIELSRYRDQAI